MTKGGWRYCKTPKTIEVMYEMGVFNPIQRADLPDKVKLRWRIESERLYELIGDLSKMFRDVKEDSLKILRENRR